MKKQLLVTLVAVATAGMAQAATLDDGKLTISGFGTLGAAQSDTDTVQFARYNQAVGVKDSPRIGLDSNLGLQASYQFNDSLSGTVQVLTRKNTSTSFTTDVTWGFLKMKVTDELSVRVGRVAAPTFLISDYQNVGYANTMMRPPIEMYGQSPMENVDGLDVNFQRAYGDTNVTAQVFAGVSRGKLFVNSGGGSVAKYDAPALGFSVSAERGPFTLRFGHARAKLDTSGIAPVNALTTSLTSLGFAQLARDITLDGGKKIAFTSLGLTMDWNDIVVQTEYAQRRAKQAVYIPDTNAWYVMGGYRIGSVLPYYAHASYRGAGSSVTVPAGLSRVPPLASAVGTLLASAEQSSNLVGVRWDFHKALALKVQVDRVKPKAKSGSLIFPTAGVQKDSVTVVAAAVDFVF